MATVLSESACGGPRLRPPHGGKRYVEEGQRFVVGPRSDEIFEHGACARTRDYPEAREGVGFRDRSEDSA